MKNILLALVLLLVSMSAFSSGGSYPSGENVVLLKDRLKFKTTDTKIITGTSTDPSVTPFDAAIGSLFIKSDDGTLFQKRDNGSSTTWAAFASATGTITGSGVDDYATRWDGTGALKTSGLHIDDSVNLTGINDLSATGTVTADTGLFNNLTATSTITAPSVVATGMANNFVYATSTGLLVGIPDWTLTDDMGLIRFRALPLEGLTGSKNFDSDILRINAATSTPNYTWNIYNNRVDIDTDDQGYDVGTNGAALNFNSSGVSHQGSSDIGTINYYMSNSAIGSGTSTFTTGGSSSFLSNDRYDAFVTLGGDTAGFKMTNFFSASTTLASTITAFADYNDVDTPSDTYTGFQSSPQIVSIKNNSNYNGVTIAPNISEFTGNAGFYGLNISPNLGSFDSAGAQGIVVNPTVTSSTYYNGVYSSTANVTSTPGAKWAGFFQGDFHGGQISSYENATTTINGTKLQVTVDTEIGGRFSSGSTLALATSTDGNPVNANSVITTFTTEVGETITNGDAFNLGTPFNLQMAASSTVTSGPFEIGATALGFPALVGMGADSYIDYINAALFAVQLIPGTSGTVENVILNRAAVIPNGTTQINNLYGFKFHLPFGNVSANQFGLYIEDAEKNYVEGRLIGDNGFQLNTATSTQPTCSQTYRGLLWNDDGGAGVADPLEVCKKNAADAYAWEAVGTGTGGGGGSGITTTSSTDNALVRWNGTSGFSIQDSDIIVDDGGYISGVAGIESATGTFTAGIEAATSTFTNLSPNMFVATNALGQLVSTSTPSGSGGGSGDLVTIFQEAQASGTSSTSTVGNGTYSLVNLNDQSGDTSFATVSSGIININTAGTYIIEAWVPFSVNNNTTSAFCKAQLNQVGTGSIASTPALRTRASGTTAGLLTVSDLYLVKEVTIGSATDFQIEAYSSSIATNGAEIGVAASSGVTEIYTRVKITKKESGGGGSGTSIAGGDTVQDLLVNGEIANSAYASGLSATTTNTRDGFTLNAETSVDFSGVSTFSTNMAWEIASVTSSTNVTFEDFNDLSGEILSGDTLSLYSPVTINGETKYIYSGTTITASGNATHSSGVTTVPTASTTGVTIGDAIVLNGQVAKDIHFESVGVGDNFVSMDKDSSELITFSANTYPAGAVHHWPLDRDTTATSTDILGTSDRTMTGTLVLSTDQVTFSKSSTDWSASNYIGVEAAEPSGNIDNGADFSVSVWFKVDSVTAGATRVITHKSNNGFSEGWSIQLTSAGVPQVSNDGGSFNSGAGAITASAWHHAVLTHTESGNTQRLYIDGVLQGTNAGDNIGDAAANQFGIGAKNNGDNPFDSAGKIQDVQYYTSVLSQTDVDFIYNGGSGVVLGSSSTVRERYSKTSLSGQVLKSKVTTSTEGSGGLVTVENHGVILR